MTDTSFKTNNMIFVTEVEVDTKAKYDLIAHIIQQDLLDSVGSVAYKF